MKTIHALAWFGTMGALFLLGLVLRHQGADFGIWFMVGSGLGGTIKIIQLQFFWPPDNRDR